MCFFSHKWDKWKHKEVAEVRYGKPWEVEMQMKNGTWHHKEIVQERTCIDCGLTEYKTDVIR